MTSLDRIHILNQRKSVHLTFSFRFQDSSFANDIKRREIKRSLCSFYDRSVQTCKNTFKSDLKYKKETCTTFWYILSFSSPDLIKLEILTWFLTWHCQISIDFITDLVAVLHEFCEIKQRLCDLSDILRSQSKLNTAYQFILLIFTELWPAW